MEDGDCIVIGGGLAGSAAALVLARAGRPVILLEKTREPHHKVCGDFLSTEAQQSLAFLGLDIWALGAEPIHNLRMVTGTRQSNAPLPFKAAGLSRNILDEALLNAAQKAGANIKRGVTVTKLQPTSNGPLIETSQQQFQARTVILASGKHDVRGLARAPGRMTAQKLQIKIPERCHALLEDKVQLVLFDGGYIGACFVENKIVTICWALESKLIKAVGAGWPAMRDFLMAQSPILASLLADAVPLYEKPVSTSAIPYGFLRREVIAPDIYPVGDQLAVIPSYTGDGTAIALHTGIEAANAILAGRTAKAYQKDMMSRLSPQFRWAGGAKIFFENSYARHIGMTISQVLPPFMTAIASATRLRGFNVAL